MFNGDYGIDDPELTANDLGVEPFSRSSQSLGGSQPQMTTQELLDEMMYGEVSLVSLL